MTSYYDTDREPPDPEPQPDDYCDCRPCGQIREQWQTARAEAAKPKPLPPLCGHCDNRWIETDRGMARCPECNPLAQGAS